MNEKQIAKLLALDTDAIRADIRALKEKIADVSVNLTPRERQAVQPIGPRSAGFVEAVLNHAKQMPQLLPPSLDIDRLQSNVDLSGQL